MSVFQLQKGADEPSFSLQKSETYLSQVQDVEFIPDAAPAEELVVIALKNTNYLRLYDPTKFKVGTLCGATLSCNLLPVFFC